MIQTLRQDKMREEYGIRLQRFYPVESHPTPFGSSWCVVEPGGSTLAHEHHEGETFFILEGKGMMRIGDETTAVSEGDVVMIPPFSQHVLENRSGAERLVFLSVWWDAMPPRPAALPARSFITVAPPTPNGGLHLGHLSGPYVASDIYRRFLDLRGTVTRFVTGSDDNQSYVPAKGAKLGWSSEKVVDTFVASIQDTFEKAAIRPDYFLKPLHTPEYVAYVQAFFRELFEKGKIVAKEVDEPWCEPCGRFLFEAHLSGICPHCATPTNAHGCEKCGITNDGRDLGSPKCNHCATPASTRKLRKLFFPLGDYAEKLAGYHATVSMNAHLRAFTTDLVKGKLSDVSASFVSDWGISVGLPGFEGQVVYEWLEMAAGYLFMAEGLEREADWSPFRRAPGQEMVQFFGFDNSFFYTAFIPALLMARDPQTPLPRAFVTNEFYRLDGLKFSTSRNHAVWGDEVLRTVDADAVRFHLAYTRPEHEQTNFTLAELAGTVKRELVDGLEAWIAGLDRTLREKFEGRAPAGVVRGPAHLAFHAAVRDVVKRMDRAYRAESFSMNEAARAVSDLVRHAVAFHHDQAFFETTNPEQWRDAVALELAALRALAIVAGPILPGFAARVLAALGEAARWDEDVAPVAQGKPIGRLEDGQFARAHQAILRFTAERGAR